jgi:hypothetical protein
MQVINRDKNLVIMIQIYLRKLSFIVLAFSSEIP